MTDLQVLFWLGAFIVVSVHGANFFMKGIVWIVQRLRDSKRR